MADIWTPIPGSILAEPWDSYMGFIQGKLLRVSKHGADAGKVTTFDNEWTLHADKTEPGFDSGGADAVVENRLHCIEDDKHKSIDIETLTWAAHEPLPVARRRPLAAGGRIGNYIVVAGGHENKVWTDLYDTRTNEWSEGPDCPMAGAGIGAVLDNELYVFRGDSTACYIYNLFSGWRAGPSIPLGTAFGATSGGGWLWLVTSGKKLYILQAGSTDWEPKEDLPAASVTTANPAMAYGNQRVHWVGGTNWEYWQYEPDVTLLPDYTDSIIPLEEVEIEIELPEFAPPPLYHPKRGDFAQDPEAAHRANQRALEQWANTLSDDNAYVWPSQWEKPVDDDRSGP